MATHPGRLTEIITGMVPAFAGTQRGRSRADQVADAVELVMATNPTLEEIADAREALLERHEQTMDWMRLGTEVPPSIRDLQVQQRAAKAEALAIVEQRLRDRS